MEEFAQPAVGKGPENYKLNEQIVPSSSLQRRESRTELLEKSTE